MAHSFPLNDIVREEGGTVVVNFCGREVGIPACCCRRGDNGITVTDRKVRDKLRAIKAQTGGGRCTKGDPRHRVGCRR